MVEQPVLERLVSELARDEGIVYEIYRDHLGYLTFGMGHLVTQDDPEYGLSEGTPIDKERVMETTYEDVQNCIIDSCRLFPELIGYPEDVQVVLCNMMFQLGHPRLSKFKRMIKAVEHYDWEQAAKEMMDSKWAQQTPVRAARLFRVMRGA